MRLPSPMKTAGNERNPSSDDKGETGMEDVVKRAAERLKESRLSFAAKPILIGGMAMEYYGMRKAGADIDLVISEPDYQKLARKDLYGDLGVVINEF